MADEAIEKAKSDFKFAERHPNKVESRASPVHDSKHGLLQIPRMINAGHLKMCSIKGELSSGAV